MKKNLQKIGFLLLALCLVICAVSCNGKQEAPAATTAAEGESAPQSPLIGDPSEEYYMVTFFSGIDFWKQCFEGFEDAAELYGVTPRYDGAPEYELNNAITVLEQIIAKNPRGIAVTCMNPDAYVEPINKAIEKGITVVTFDSDAPLSKRYANLSTGNYYGGVLAARQMAKFLGEKGEVGVVGVPGQLNLEQRTNGFLDTIKNEYPNMKVVQVVNGNAEEMKGAEVTASLIQAWPNMKGVYACNANMGIGVGSAVEEAKKTDDIYVVSFDVDPGLIAGIDDGTIDACIAQGAWNMGFWSMQCLYLVEHDLVSPVQGWREKGVNPLPPYFDTGVSVVTKENVDAFRR